MNAMKSKTLNTAAVLGILGAVQANLPMLQDLISPAWYGYIMFGVAIVFAGLRVVTKKPLSEK